MADAARRLPRWSAPRQVAASFTMTDDSRWMNRVLELARRGEALASPNPMVGCVIARRGRVVGEGFHVYDRKKHAEIVALEKAGARARGATLYVNLEPCCHTGRTGPCTAAIIAAGVKRVVAAMRDPNPAVAGRGISRLRRAGIAVEVGVCQAEARRLNSAFAKWVTTGMPLVTLKSALSLDWRIAPAAHRRNARNRWISSLQSRREAQKMRHAHDAVLTGIGTVLADDPLLTDRTGKPRRRRLLRVVLDSKLRLPLKSKLVKSARGDVLVFTTQPLESARATALRLAGVELVRITGANRPDLRAVLAELGRMNILSVMMEAGSGVNGAALQARLVERLALFFAPKILGKAAPVFAEGLHGESEKMELMRNLDSRQIARDFLMEGYLRDVYGNR